MRLTALQLALAARAPFTWKIPTATPNEVMRRPVLSDEPNKTAGRAMRTTAVMHTGMATTTDLHVSDDRLKNLLMSECMDKLGRVCQQPAELLRQAPAGAQTRMRQVNKLK